MKQNRTAKTVSDATIPDPEELDERDVGELHDIPLPERVRRDIHAGGDGPDDEDVNEEVDLDDGLPVRKGEDLTHGDEGIDDPSPIKD
ncbi:MAG TPA: hypothetical protein VD994_04230 [Prosthecobacter sp.]|nr:hypothetical protein [Prosthecobacter sp.]